MAMALNAPPLNLHFRRRWKPAMASMKGAKQLVEAGVVHRIAPSEVVALVSSSGGYKLIDIRPKWERENAYVSGSYHVPLFVEDEDVSVLTMMKKWIHFGYIGAWMGHKFTMSNASFVEQVSEVAASKDEKMLLACGEGLRSLLAAEKLYLEGYTNLAWLDGGFGASKNSDFGEVVGSDIRYANVGGLAQYFLKLTLLLQGAGV